MTNYDRNKLNKAGFTILRAHDRMTSFEFKITCMRPGDSGWSRMETFKSNAAMQREVERINKNEPLMIFE